MRKAAAIALLLTGCATPLPQGPVAPPAWVHATGSHGGLSGSWWTGFGDTKLDGLVQEAWRNNPEIEVALQRVEAARADRFGAMAMLFPKAGLGLGFREGREKDRTTGFRAMDLEPWTAEGGISWELDVTGRLGARLSAATSAETAAYARWQGVRLMIATEMCAARFEQSVLANEIGRQRVQLAAEEKAAGLMAEMLERGLVSSADHAARVADLESLRRGISELERLRDGAGLRLGRLLGGATVPPAGSSAPNLPAMPSRLPAEVFRKRPDLIAAEAGVRQAFAIKDASRLDLLPSLSLGMGGEAGANSLRGEYGMWKASAGPRLDIPVWDPDRIAAMKRSRAEAAAASAEYRSTADKAVEEVEAAYLDLGHFRRQLASLEREADAKERAWKDSLSKLSTGAGSAIDAADAGQGYHTSAAMAARMRLRALTTHLRLIRALGG